MKYSIKDVLLILLLKFVVFVVRVLGVATLCQFCDYGFIQDEETGELVNCPVCCGNGFYS
jgi:hypothetical protein